MIGKKIVVCDSHPVQYRVPIWRRMQQLSPGSIHVIYASDCSVRGHTDREFGQVVKWDDPMLDDYSYTVLNCENGPPLTGWNSLTGRGLRAELVRLQPDAVLLTGLNYRFDLVALLSARSLGIPVWLRCENQDFAQERSFFKLVIRTLIYSRLYREVKTAFFIGELNRLHYLQHGFKSDELIPARYATVDRYEHYSESDKSDIGSLQRTVEGIEKNAIVVGFSGKFIEKKNPEILFEMVRYLSSEIRDRLTLYFVGSGEMIDDLKKRGVQLYDEFGVKTYFSGFVNQTEIYKYYLMMDVLVLPSKRMGETWGLVANEAMQAGCNVIVSDAVGCGVDFRNLPRFRTFRNNEPQDLAAKLEILAKFKKDFNWAASILERYSVESSVIAIQQKMSGL